MFEEGLPDQVGRGVSTLLEILRGVPAIQYRSVDEDIVSTLLEILHRWFVEWLEGWLRRR